MSENKKICVVTCSRADYWLLKELITLLHQDKHIDLQLFVTGGHLVKSQGHTLNNIITDGFTVTATIESTISSDSYLGMTKTIGLTVISFADHYALFKPDLVVVLGDRFETLAAALAAYSLKIPVAHIHGGELSFGALDDNFRHAITKFSSLHFVSHERYGQRVRQLGEDPASIYVVGAPCVDQIQEVPMPRAIVLQALALTPGSRYVLFCYHSSTTGSIDDDLQIAKNCLDALLAQTEFDIVITKANIDPGGEQLNTCYDLYVLKYPNRIRLFRALGGELYFGAITHSEFFIGNSSSGIIEVHYFKKAAINVGRRQEERITSSAVYHCDGSYVGLITAIRTVQESAWRTLNVVEAEPVYGKSGFVSKKIFDVLCDPSRTAFGYKKFFDR